MERARRSCAAYFVIMHGAWVGSHCTIRAIDSMLLRCRSRPDSSLQILPHLNDRRELSRVESESESKDGPRSMNEVFDKSSGCVA